MRTILLPFFLIISIASLEQQSTIRGKVLGEQPKEPLPFVNVTLEQEDNLILGTTSDFDGNYILNSVPYGIYNLKFSFVGFQPKEITNIKVDSDSIVVINPFLKEGIYIPYCGGCFFGYINPFYEKDNNTIQTTFTRQDIMNSPY